MKYEISFYALYILYLIIVYKDLFIMEKKKRKKCININILIINYFSLYLI